VTIPQIHENVELHDTLQKISAHDLVLYVSIKYLARSSGSDVRMSHI